MTDDQRTPATEPTMLTFAEFMDAALYGPEGFYTTGGSAGRRGDFITSVEVGPLFGAVIARYLDAEWRRLGSPDTFTVVEAGAGPGTLARSIAAASPDCRDALDYVAVEVSAAQRAKHPAGVRSVASIADLADTKLAGADLADPGVVGTDLVGVVLANELLDNLPFDLVVYDDGWRPALARHEGDRWVEVLGAKLDPVPSVLPTRAELGARAPLQRSAGQWVADARALLTAGSVLVFDYGVARTAELVMRPWRDWLRTYRGQSRGGHYLDAPGTQDITVDVAFDQLPEPTSIRPQAQWLQLHGIDELVTEGRDYWESQSSAPDLHAMRMRSRISESEALLAPDDLGSFWALEWQI